MPSYTDLKILLMDDGTFDTTWGQQTNANLSALTASIAGTEEIVFSGVDITLDLTNSNSPQDARNIRLVCTGTSGGARNLNLPLDRKFYVVQNSLADTLTVKTVAGTGIAIPTSRAAILYCDGTNIISGVTYFNNLSVGTLTSSGLTADSPTFTGTPIAPTPAPGTNNTQIATTAFVQVAAGNLGTMSTQNANNVNITGGTVGGVTVSNSSLAGTSLVITNTGSVTLATGTTAQRPVSPLVGMFRMNTSLNMPEWYDPTNGRWNLFSDLVNTYAVEYLIVGGGGGGGGRYYSGGGGGGGVLSGIFIVTEGTSYSVGVGAGGAGGAGDNYNGVPGQPSFFGGIIAPGGGGGGSYNNRDLAIGGDGGCGGGNSGYYPADNTNNAYNMRGVGLMGFHGGYGGGYGGGGGGGAGANGSNGTSTSGGAGGAGRVSTITGTSVTYAGGGGGGAHASQGPGGAGGAGGGGAGASGGNSPGAGTANTGGGGGGVDSDTSGSGSGGSGVVIVRYFGGTRATGGTITTSGAYTIHRFTSSGTFGA
jgi:hypothetical protein